MAIREGLGLSENAPDPLSSTVIYFHPLSSTFIHSGTNKVQNSVPVPGPIGSNRYWYVYGSGIPDLNGPTASIFIQVIPTHPPRTYLHQDVAQKQQFVSLSVGKNSCIPRCDYQAIVTTWRVCHPGKCDQYHGVTMV